MIAWFAYICANVAAVGLSYLSTRMCHMYCLQTQLSVQDHTTGMSRSHNHKSLTRMSEDGEMWYICSCIHHNTLGHGIVFFVESSITTVNCAKHWESSVKSTPPPPQCLAQSTPARVGIAMSATPLRALYTCFASPGRPVHSDTNSASPSTNLDSSLH